MDRKLICHSNESVFGYNHIMKMNSYDSFLFTLVSVKLFILCCYGLIILCKNYESNRSKNHHHSFKASPSILVFWTLLFRNQPSPNTVFKEIHIQDWKVQTKNRNTIVIFPVMLFLFTYFFLCY